MIDYFSRQEFEAALPKGKNTNRKLWEEITDPKTQKGEHVYIIEIGIEGVYILVRSSVSTRTGRSNGNGEDSIRLYLVDGGLRPLSIKLSKWITRVPGWEKRMWVKFGEMRKLAQKAGNCKKCGQRKIFKVKKEGSKNKGRLFAKCDHEFIWLT